ncbi:uncharacterized protein [Gossypium hirsutum]|uniref:CCHC-type domain-containing protein n=1 Tax=Gossypium hirsutum TaxID=3635 RepID=A0ABM2YX74_GOSHI|nr:uncharacterized protein LOC121207981 [Gossypium hirsutum]
MDDLDCTPEQKLKGVVPLLRDESNQWSLTVKEGTWEFFKTAFQGKYVGASYVDTQRREFLNLTQGDKSMTEYEAEFLRLSRYTRGMVATEYECCVHFEDGPKDSLRVLIAAQRKRDVSALVDKAKIAEDMKRSERQNREKERGRNRRDLEPSSLFLRPKKKPRANGLARVETPIAVTGPQPCADCGRRHQGDCWRRIGACFRCGSLEHRIRDCPQRPDQMQAIGMDTVQLLRGV